MRIELISFVAGPLVALLITLSFAVDAQAQFLGYHPVEDVAGFKKQFVSESAKVKSIISDFTQEKTLTALTEKIISNGKFWFKRSNKVRLEYTHPFVYRMIMNGDKLIVRDAKKENTINIRSNKLFQQVNRIMIDCVQGTILDSKDFATRVFENDKNILLEMTPTSKTLREFFEAVVLVVDKKDYAAESITMNEPQGDITVIHFIHKKLNEDIPDTVFVP